VSADKIVGHATDQVCQPSDPFGQYRAGHWSLFTRSGGFATAHRAERGA
jgi:hypothetical protein